MSKTTGILVIKKYANRRLYNTGTSTYVTLEDLAKMIRKGEDFSVRDAKSGEDITHSVLTQIIFEQEAKSGSGLMPVSFLRQLISYYGDQLQIALPVFLDYSMKAFAEQHRQMLQASGQGTTARNQNASMKAMEEQAQRNAENFRQAMQMLMPSEVQPSPPPRRPAMTDIDEMKEQLRNLQNRLDNLG